MSETETDDALPLSVELRDGRTAVISRVTEQDAAATLSYLELVAGESNFLSFGPGESGLTLESELDYIRTLEDPAKGLMLKAVVAGDIVGTVTLGRGARPRLRHAGELGLAVRKKYWGLGLGRALSVAAIAEARKTDLKRISLRVRADNPRAIRLYESLGFQHEGRLVGAFEVAGSEYDDLAMGLRLIHA